MKSSQRLAQLPDYPFLRMRRMLDGKPPGGKVINFTVGEPRLTCPDWVAEIVAETASGFGRYPRNFGSDELLSAIAGWLRRRYGVTVDQETQLMALNGSREGLFGACIALCPDRLNGSAPYVLMPNPFYQVYAGGAAAAGAIPYFVEATKETGFLPDYSAVPIEVLEKTALIYICSPANPQGSVADRDYLRTLLELAERFGIRILSDECYSEIYRGEPPPGLLEVTHEAGADPEKSVVFQSLSKRSGLPGLRSGFVAGGSKAVAAIKQLRAYGGAPVPSPLMAVSAFAWSDEKHVDGNRLEFRRKFDLADRIFAGMNDYASPEAGMFLWIDVGDGEKVAEKLWTEAGLRVLPGAFFGRTVKSRNPGSAFIRVALVAERVELEEGLELLRSCLCKLGV